MTKSSFSENSAPVWSELDAMMKRVSAGEAPSEAARERFQELVAEITRDNPLVRDLTEAYQLFDALAPTRRALSSAEKASVVAALVMAGERKIELFSAISQIGQSAE